MYWWIWQGLSPPLIQGTSCHPQWGVKFPSKAIYLQCPHLIWVMIKFIIFQNLETYGHTRHPALRDEWKHTQKTWKILKRWFQHILDSGEGLVWWLVQLILILFNKVWLLLLILILHNLILTQDCCGGSDSDTLINLSEPTLYCSLHWVVTFQAWTKHEQHTEGRRERERGGALHREDRAQRKLFEFMFFWRFWKI